MNRLGTLALAACVLGTLTLATGCAAEYVHDPAAFFPEDFETSWTKVSDCKASQHGGKYVVVYANASALAALDDAAVTEYPQDASFAKAQFDASDCSGGYAAITAMRKDAPGSGGDSDWKWQQVNDDGSIGTEAYDAPGCIGCHQGAGTGKDLVATE